MSDTYDWITAPSVSPDVSASSGSGSGLLDWFTTPPADGTMFGKGGSGSNWMDLMMAYGGTNMGISPQQSAAHLAKTEKQGLMDFIAANTLPAQEARQLVAPMQAPPLGSGLFNLTPQDMAANTAINQPALPARFDPSKYMELAARGGWLPEQIRIDQARQAVIDKQNYEANNLTLYQKTMKQLREAELAQIGLFSDRKYELDKDKFEFQKSESDRNYGLATSKQEGSTMKPEANHAWYDTPNGKVQAPLPGTSKWREEQGNYDTIQAGVKGAKDLITHIQNNGTFELWNGPAAAKANVARQSAISGLGILSNMGVLQPGDYDRLSKQLIDPSNASFGNLTTRNSTAIAAAQEVAERLTAAGRSQMQRVPSLRAYSTTPPPPK